nr:DUF1264 domain-containing protein [Candidatus Pantoea persica]
MHDAPHVSEQASASRRSAFIYDGNTKDARLMGVEYIISARLYQTLPPEEKKLWHSHDYEVKSGTLIAPSLPQAANHALIARIANTYGKTWHTDRDKTLPLRIPALMMGFTADGQLDNRLLADHDKRFDIDSRKIRASRADIVTQPVLPGANAWQRGEVIQLKRVSGGGEHAHGHTHFRPAEQLSKPQS